MTHRGEILSVGEFQFSQKFVLSWQNPYEDCVFRIKWAMEMFAGAQVGKAVAFFKVYDQVHLSLTAFTQ